MCTYVLSGRVRVKLIREPTDTTHLSQAEALESDTSIRGGTHAHALNLVPIRTSIFDG